MTLAAVDDLEDALEATKALLWPFDAGVWLRLAVVAFFVGGAGGSGGGGGGGGGGDGGTGTLPGFGTVPDPALTDAALAAIVVVAGLLVLLALAYAAIGAVMEFVLVESLRREAVHLRRYVADHWRAGLRLFGFRLGVGLLALAGVAVVVGVGFLAAGGTAALQTPLRLAAVALLALPVLFGIGLVAALGLGLTTAFVVPVMVLEGTTVLGGWRRFWPTLRADWPEYGVYVLVTVVLRLGVGVLLGAVLGVVAVGVFVPVGAVGVAAYLAGGGQLGLATLAVLGGLGLAGLAVVLAVSAVVRVPVVTYFRYYALLVLGDTDGELDLVADRRAAIRDAGADG